MDPRPDLDERIFWGDEREDPKPIPMPRPYARLRFWLWQLYCWAFVGYGLYNMRKYAPRDEMGSVIWSDLLPSIFTSFGEVILFLALVVGVIFLVRSAPRFTSVTKKAMPLWLSEHRLTYVPAADSYGTSLPLEQIQFARLDYANGSLAVCLKTASDTIHLLTSDAKNLLHNLYTLRPDLEPTS